MTKRNMTAKITKPAVTPVAADKAIYQGGEEIVQSRAKIYGFAMIAK